MPITNSWLRFTIGRFFCHILVASALLLVLPAVAQLPPDKPAENSGGFRGPARNGIFATQGLLKEWPTAGPKLLWEAQVGAGWTAGCVADGVVYFCGQKGGVGSLSAFDLDGKPLWKVEYGADKEPRATPVVVDGLLFYETVGSVLYALDAKTGAKRWSYDLTLLGDSSPTNGGNTASPLVIAGRVIVAMRSGGDGIPSYAAFECATGKLVWKGDLSPSPEKGKGWSSYHGTPIPVRLGERDAIFCDFYRGVGAVWADTGEKCWTDAEFRGKSRVQIQPVSNEGFLFLNGTLMARIAADGKISKLWEGKVKVSENNVSYSHSIIKDGKLYAFTPNKLLILDATSGETKSSLAVAAKGAILWADGMIYLQDNRPGMMLIEETKDGLREVSSFRLPFPGHRGSDGIQLFTQPIVAEGRLFLRDQSHVLVYDLRAPNAEKTVVDGK